ncbi:unnamed protein product [Adineta steineri]|uniref:Uncharacterized protein n=2 Tax=Adineta steineri TaxID=433720 RepID=A0A815M1V2_9BILA|nr:unnamed protein product [Adineta steineri]CAF3793127.1 unnamed protein product [Adineta steineri]
MSRVYKKPTVIRVLTKDLPPPQSALKRPRTLRPSSLNIKPHNLIRLPRRSRSNPYPNRNQERNTLIEIKLEDIRPLEKGSETPSSVFTRGRVEPSEETVYVNETDEAKKNKSRKRCVFTKNTCLFCMVAAFGLIVIIALAAALGITVSNKNNSQITSTMTTATTTTATTTTSTTSTTTTSTTTTTTSTSTTSTTTTTTTATTTTTTTATTATTTTATTTTKTTKTTATTTTATTTTSTTTSETSDTIETDTISDSIILSNTTTITSTTTATTSETSDTVATDTISDSIILSTIRSSSTTVATSEANAISDSNLKLKTITESDWTISM